MKKSLFDKIKLQIALRKFGIKKSDLRKMYKATKYLEEHQPKFSYKMEDLRLCDKL